MKHFRHEHFQECTEAFKKMHLAIETGLYTKDKHMIDPSAQADMYALLARSMPQIEHFVVDLDMLPKVKKDELGNMPMPFNEMLIGFETQRDVEEEGALDSTGLKFAAPPVGVLFVRDGDESSILPISRISKDEWIASSYFINVNHETMKFSIVPAPGITPDFIDEAESSLKQLIPWLASISVMTTCSNVSIEKDAPSRLRKMRAKKHGMTLKPYSVIKLPGRNFKYKAGSGGHHATPALHHRRGHFRTLQKGKRYERKIWVRDCMVGDPARGKVEHDYILRRNGNAKGEVTGDSKGGTTQRPFEDDDLNELEKQRQEEAMQASDDQMEFENQPEGIV